MQVPYTQYREHTQLQWVLHSRALATQTEMTSCRTNLSQAGHSSCVSQHKTASTAHSSHHEWGSALKVQVKVVGDRGRQVTLADKPLMRVLPFSSFTSAVSSYSSSSGLQSILHMHQQHCPADQAPCREEGEGKQEKSPPPPPPPSLTAPACLLYQWWTWQISQSVRTLCLVQALCGLSLLPVRVMDNTLATHTRL